MHLFRYASRLSNQGAFKKFVQSHFDRTEIVTRIGFQEAVTGQRVNFSVVYIDRHAAEPISPSLAVPTHAVGCGRALCDRGDRWGCRHLSCCSAERARHFSPQDLTHAGPALIATLRQLGKCSPRYRVPRFFAPHLWLRRVGRAHSSIHARPRAGLYFEMVDVSSSSVMPKPCTQRLPSNLKEGTSIFCKPCNNYIQLGLSPYHWNSNALRSASRPIFFENQHALLSESSNT